MKKIELTQGLFALVDDEDFAWLSQWKWRAQKTSYGELIAVRKGRQGEKEEGKMIRMHRQIMDSPKGMEVDHRNHITLDNQRRNLRPCTRSQNAQNQRKQSGTTSKFKGVCFCRFKANKNWMAAIKLNGKRTHIGYFADEIDAAKAYDKKAKKLFGEFAFVNFP